MHLYLSIYLSIHLQEVSVSHYVSVLFAHTDVMSPLPQELAALASTSTNWPYTKKM